MPGKLVSLLPFVEKLLTAGLTQLVSLHYVVEKLIYTRLVSLHISVEKLKGMFEHHQDNY